MKCEECGVEIEDDARGWRGYRTDWPGEEPELAFYCPLCAETRFGYFSKRSQRLEAADEA